MSGETLRLDVPAFFSGEQVQDFEAGVGHQAEPAVGMSGESSSLFVDEAAFAIDIEFGEVIGKKTGPGEVEVGAGPEPAMIEQGEGGESILAAMDDDAAAAEQRFFGREDLLFGGLQSESPGAGWGIGEGLGDEFTGPWPAGPAAEIEHGIGGDGGAEAASGSRARFALAIGIDGDEFPCEL